MPTIKLLACSVIAEYETVYVQALEIFEQVFSQIDSQVLPIYIHTVIVTIK